MALFKSKIGDVPEGAVVLSEMDALKYQMETVKNWPKTSEVFAIKYGPYALGTAALLSGVFFNNYFRWKFILGNYGRLSSYLPVCLIPGTVTVLAHTELVLRDVILMKNDTCPVCLELRAAALQSMIGVAFPALVAPLGCASLALRYHTYDVPLIHQEPKKALMFFGKLFGKIQTKTIYFFIAQAFLGSVVTYFETCNLINISKAASFNDEKVFDD